ncbi:MAG: DegT/DnrJ/EryC1/StrS family aminotransferase, partial [Candidatus Thioglobus sp.]
MINWPSYSQEEIDAVSAVLQSGEVNYWTGVQCRNFETEFAQFCNSKYAVALMNGTVAIDIALKALNIGKGDEVIVTSRTFIASVSAIINVGAIPVFADVDIDSQNIQPDSVREKVTNNTKAVVC